MAVERSVLHASLREAKSRQESFRTVAGSPEKRRVEIDVVEIPSALFTFGSIMLSSRCLRHGASVEKKR